MKDIIVLEGNRWNFKKIIYGRWDFVIMYSKMNFAFMRCGSYTKRSPSINDLEKVLTEIFFNGAGEFTSPGGLIRIDEVLVNTDIEIRVNGIEYKKLKTVEACKEYIRMLRRDSRKENREIEKKRMISA